MKKGITLIEVLVASSLLVIAISPLLISIPLRKSIILNNRYRLLANTIIKEKFERIYGVTGRASKLALLNDDDGNLYTSSNPEVILIKGENGLSDIDFKLYYPTVRNISLGDDTYIFESGYTADVLEIEIEASWNYNGKTKSISLTGRTRE